MNLWIALGCLIVGLLMVFWAMLLVRRSPSPGDQLSVLSRFFLVALRLAIGWHFLIEGVHKFELPNWSSEVYLRESIGPAAPYMRKLAGDPVVEKLTPGDKTISPALEREWKRYFDAYVSHYKLDAEQQKIAQMNFDQIKAETFDWLRDTKQTVSLPAMYPPEDVRVSLTVAKRLELIKDYEKVLREVESDMANTDPRALRARIERLKKAEQEKLVDLDKEIAGKSGEEKEKLIQERNVAVAKAKINIDGLNNVVDSLKKEADVRYLAAKKNLADFRTELKRDLDARTDYFKKNVLPAPPEEKKEAKPEVKSAKEEKKSEEKKSEEKKVEEKKIDLKTVLRKEQADMVPLGDVIPTPVGQWTLLDWSNAMVKYGLVVVGACLLLGFFSRLSAFAGAMYLLMFFVAMPPLPWYPENPKSEGHYLFLNKNIIEMLALLALATLPTGRWVGVDALTAMIFRGRQNAPASGKLESVR